MDEAEQLHQRAEEYLEAAEDAFAHDPPLLSPAFDHAHLAAELAGKSLLLRQTGSYPREHQIAGAIGHAGLIPHALEAKTLGPFFNEYNRARYDLAAVSEDEVRDARHIAGVMVAASTDWPAGPFHPAWRTS